VSFKPAALPLLYGGCKMKKKSVFIVLFVLFNQFVFSQEWSYEMNYAGTGVVITKYRGNSKKVNIPARIEGYPVVYVGYRCFYGNNSVEEVTIPATVTQIGQSSFELTPNLRKVVIPNSVTTIDPYAFAGSGLFQVEIPDSVTSISWEAFRGTSDLRSVRLSRNITEISHKAFRNSALTEIIIPEGVDGIGDEAFYGCSNLRAVTLPSTIKTISRVATFAKCKNLSVINIPDSVKSIRFETYAPRISDGMFAGTAFSLSTQSLLRRLGYTGAF
jgi:hypothetical protein